jgi:predicted phosphodiesterase
MSQNKVAIISDIHSNCRALEAVLRHAQSQKVSSVWFLGDLIGYGPDPHKCLAILKQEISNKESWILGNHDLALNCHTHENIQNTINPSSPCSKYIGFKEDTLKAHETNRILLETLAERKKELLSHPLTSIIGNQYFLVHGGLRNGSPATTYIKDHIQASEEYWVSSSPRERRLNPQINIIFSGHTHIPACFNWNQNNGKMGFSPFQLIPCKNFILDENHIWYLNPGSVGQPRDGDNRASYMIFDTDEKILEFHRVEYNIRNVQSQMERLQMPENLINRLQEAR